MHQKSPTGEVETLEDVISQAADDTPGVTADPPTATEDANTELDFEAVVRKAAEINSEEAEAPSAEGEGSEEPEAAKPEAEAEKPPEKTPEELAKEQEEADAKLPFHKHPRWKEVQEDRKQLRAKVQEFEAKMAEVTPKAEQLDRIGGFMRENELTAEEVQRGFEIMALMKHNPAAALEKLMPHLDVLELASGRKLPPDLQERVDAGEVTPDIAREAAKARMDAQLARTRVERTEQAIQQTRAQEAATAMRTAVDSWEATVKATDPDYPHMQSFIIDRTRVLMQQTPPRSPDEAVTLAKRAYDDVKAQMRRVMPQRTPTRPMTSDKSSTTAVATPKTLEDVVKLALR